MSVYRVTHVVLFGNIEEFWNRTAITAARVEGNRYWWDYRGKPRLMPGMKPILSHGKRSRR